MTIRISGIRVRAGLTSLLLLAVIAAGIASSIERTRATQCAYALLVFAAAVALLLGHEAVRIAVYRRIGVTVRGLDLFVTGGNLALIDRTSSPRNDVLAGLSGLAPVLALAGVAWAFDRATIDNTEHEFVHLLAIVAISFAVLQAMPALPLDGGRLTRGLFWYLTGNPVAGAHVSAVYGHVVALGMMTGGTLLLTERGSLPYWGFALVVAGWQTSAASWASYRDSRWQAAGAGLAIADANLPLPGRIAGDASIEAVVDSLIEEGDRSVLLVVDDANAPIGVVELANLRRVRRSAWADFTAVQVMTRLDSVHRIAAGTTVVDALTELDRANVRIAFAESDDRQAALVLREHLLRLIVDRPEPRR